MLFKVCQYSDAIQKLKEYGHMSFLKHEISLPCSNYLQDLSSLDCKVGEQENTLNVWINYVWSCRYNYPHLNFYTTNQLMLLRKELSNIHRQETHEISLQAFRLLHSTVGKPVDSTMLVKKALNDEVHNLIDDDCQEELETVASLDEEFVASPENLVNEEVQESKIAEATQALNDEQKKLFDELINCSYEDYVVLEAITNGKNDVFTAMEWCDELSEDEKADIESKWLGCESSFSSAVVIATEATMAPSSNLQHQSFYSEYIDTSRIANYFFESGQKGLFNR